MKPVTSQSEPEVWARITLTLAGGYGKETCKMRVAVRNAVQAQILMWSYSELLKTDVGTRLIE